MFFMQLPPGIVFDDLALAVGDELVNYRCATNEGGQYCAVAELNIDFNEVCTKPIA